MTTAHRPTFDPARGKDPLRGPAYHQRLLPAYKTLKHRQSGQGNEAENSQRDLRAELLEAEAAHFAKKGKSVTGGPAASSAGAIEGAKNQLAIEDGVVREGKRSADDESDDSGEDPEAKRRRLILEEAADIDRDSEISSDEEDDEDEDESDEEDEEAVLMRELGKIKKERAEQKAKEDAERAAKEEEKREFDIARGNPLLNPKDFSVKRRWDEDVVFKNQARGTEEKGKSKEFVNDLLRSDFHKRFMGRYVR
ncbi:Cwf15/Cwc15 cell cycle control protein [Viridothelium virens]|uniref:Cwf15/Cwc15 cell cycle control protein n=1 Tax=Viridothelium virens TaxID=1048519 RepID=A0A6A6H6G5_VIRVR|nr:Cwf15/Cwc15 cell cycle control protein [Viridothelium virens]